MTGAKGASRFCVSCLSWRFTGGHYQGRLGLTSGPSVFAIPNGKRFQTSVA
jgi:hypothetical protein